MSRASSVRAGWAVVAALLAAATFSTPTGRPVAEAAVTCTEEWTKVPSAPELRQPRAIAAIDANDAWIVGARGIEAGVVRTGAQHWNGDRWSLVSTPNVGTTGENALNDVDGVSGADLWSVGYWTSGDAEGSGNFKTLVQHWQGSTWTRVDSPNAGTATESSALIGVDVLPSGNAWAVGYHRSGIRRNTLIERWNGNVWRIVPSPNPGNDGNALVSVAAVHGNNVWAVGWQLGADGLRSLIVRWNGTSWSTVAAPHVGTGDNVLTGVGVLTGKEVWAVGYAVDGARHRPLTLRYDGTSWTSVPPPADGGDVTFLRGVSVVGADDVWAVGGSFRPGPSTIGAWSQHWDGDTWLSVPNAALSRGDPSDLLAVAGVPGSAQVWATGRIARVETICPAPTATAVTASSEEQQDDATTSFGVRSVASAGEPVPAAATPVEARDVAPDAGLGLTTKTRGAVIGDFTGDGLPDIFLGRHQDPAHLYRNDDGAFTEISGGVFKATDRHGCDAADVDGTGTLDVYCAVGAARGTITKRNELYLQGGDGSFADHAAAFGVLEPFARGRSATFVDADGRGGPDLFLANFPDRADGLPSPNRLFLNQGGSFLSAPEFGLEQEVDSGAPTGGNPVARDLDLDGWDDLVMDTFHGLVVYRNEQGRGFADVTSALGLDDENPVDFTLSDVDGDGDLDVVSVTGSRLRIVRNDGQIFRLVFTTTIQLGKAVGVGDVNGDDRPDVYVMTGSTSAGTNAPDRVYLNNGTGTSFAPMSIPSASTGAADSVWPIDHDGNGLTDFLALNGRTNAGGPVQLIAFFPAP